MLIHHEMLAVVWVSQKKVQNYSIIYNYYFDRLGWKLSALCVISLFRESWVNSQHPWIIWDALENLSLGSRMVFLSSSAKFPSIFPPRR